MNDMANSDFREFVRPPINLMAVISHVGNLVWLNLLSLAKGSRSSLIVGWDLCQASRR